MTRTPTLTTLNAALVLALATLAAACSVGPSYVTPSPRFLNNPSPSTNTPPVDASWWAAFNDPILNQLQDTAATNNLDLAAASNRLLEARALWNEARFDFLPTVTSEAHYQNNQPSLYASPFTLSRGRRHMELYRAGFDATWELDVFGRVRRTVQAARATVQSVTASRDDLLVSVRAELAANYVHLRGLQTQLGAARESATNQAATLQLAEQLLSGGRGTQLDVARARSQLNGTLAAIPPLEAALDRSIHRIGVLCGHPPRTFAPLLESPAPVPTVPILPDPPQPHELLRRRPDIRAAEQSLAAATARIGIAVADLFPRITFQGRLGLEANRLSGFERSGTDSFGFGPSISWAAFDLGRVRQSIRAADARAQSTLAVYEQTVLLALEETENALRTYSRAAQHQTFLSHAATAADEAARLARQRYEDGVADYLAVLDAERVLLSQRVELARAQAETTASAIAIYKSFGGGWSLDLPTP